MTDTTETQEKRPVGRPSLYDFAYCERVIELGRLGKSVEQIAANLGFSLRVLYDWRDKHEEFLHALEYAKELEQAWWEEQAHLYMLEVKDGPKLNASLWSRSMAARFPKKYRESVKTEVTGADGAPLLAGINVTFVKPNE
jgi:transposase-like protein